MAEAAGRQHAPRRDAPVRHGLGHRATRAPTPPATAATTSLPKACPVGSSSASERPASHTSSSREPARSASTTTTSASRRWSSRSTRSGTAWDLSDELAEPGYYSAMLGSGVRCEITVGPKSAVHRYTFPDHADARLVVDLSLGGLAIDNGATVPIRAQVQSLTPGSAQERSSSRAHRSRSTSSATPPDGGRCSGTTAV